MPAERIGHIGIAAADGNKMVSFFVEHLNGVLKSRTEYPERKQISNMVQIGDCELEIMEGTAPDGVVGKFLEKRGAGLHHISLQVKNLVELAEKLEASGVQLIGKDFEDPVVHVAFISPKSSGGVLIEMYEYLEGK